MADNPEVEKLEARIKELEEQIEEEREEHEWDLKAAQESSAQTVKKLEEEVARLQKAGGGKRGKASDDVEMLTQRALLAERRVAELQEDLKRARNMAPPPPPKGGDALLRQRAEAAEHEREDLRREKRALERSLEEKTTAVQRARKELEQSKQLKQELEAAKADLAARDKELQEARNSSAGSIEEKEQKVHELAQELNELAGVEAERDALTAEVQQLRATVAENQNTIARLEASGEEAASIQEQELGRRVAEAEAEAGRLKQEMAQMQMASGQMMEQRERETERLKTDLKDASDQQALANEQVAGLNRELTRLRDELAVTASERDELVEQMRALRDHETVVTKPPTKPAPGDGAALPPAGPDVFQDRTQKAPSPRGAQADERAMPVVAGEMVEPAMRKSEDLFLEDETTKKTERVRFTKGFTEQAEVPPSPDEGSPSEDEIPPPAIESIEQEPAAPEGQPDIAEEDLPEVEIVADDAAAADTEADVIGQQEAPTEQPEVVVGPVSAPPPSEAVTQRDGAPLQERTVSKGPSPKKAGGRGGLLIKALVIGVFFGIVVVGALHFFPKWFGPGKEGEIDADPNDVAAGQADAGTAAGTGASAADGGQDEVPPADHSGAAGQTAADASGTESPQQPGDSAEQAEGEQETGGSTPEVEAFEVTPEVRKTRSQGRRLIKRKKYRKAIRFLEKKLEQHPGDPVLHYLAGRCLFRLHQVAESLQELERAVELDPGFTDAYFELGGVYLKVKKRAKACHAMKRFVELESGSKRSRGVQGNIRLLKCR